MKTPKNRIFFRIRWLRAAFESRFLEDALRGAGVKLGFRKDARSALGERPSSHCDHPAGRDPSIAKGGGDEIGDLRLAVRRSALEAEESRARAFPREKREPRGSP